MKYIVSELGPIDQRLPGADVTAVYTDEVLQRLIEDGYVVEVKPPPASTPKRADKRAAKEAADGD